MLLQAVCHLHDTVSSQNTGTDGTHWQLPVCCLLHRPSSHLSRTMPRSVKVIAISV